MSLQAVPRFREAAERLLELEQSEWHSAIWWEVLLSVRSVMQM